MPPDAIQAFRAEIGAHPDEPCRFWVSDGLLLVLASISAEFEGRVLTHRPDLVERVADVRRNPGAFVDLMRTELSDPHP
jgi:hypothetical protein